MARIDNHYDRAAELAVLRLREGAAPWQRRYFGEGYGPLPMNPATGKRYHVGNFLFLLLQEHDDPRWLTYRQARDAGAEVRRGERGMPVVYWIFEEEQGGELVELERPHSLVTYVFNAEQIEGMPAFVPDAEHIPDVERAEKLLAASGARIVSHGRASPYYRQDQDVILLPGKECFPDGKAYYATALHELLHWTGHSSRLNRKCGPFGSPDYASEELRAGIGSRLLAAELGIGMSVDRHDGYARIWVELLKKDSRELYRAAAEAEEMAAYVLGLAE